MCADIYLTKEEEDHHNLIYLTALKLHVNLLIKNLAWLSQALTVSLGAEYIMQRSTLILYGQINPTSLRVTLPPCLSTPPLII